MTDQQPPRYQPYGSQQSQPAWQQPGAPQYPGQGYPGGPPGHAQVPPKKKHRMRIGCLSALGVFVVLIIIVAIAASLGGGKTPNSSRTGAATASAPASSPARAQAAAPKPHVLIRFVGSDIRNSAPFNVGNGPLTVRYSFNCASFGESGNFVADLLYGNQSSLNSDDAQIANALALHGSQTTTVYPQDPGKNYYLSVNSECSWRVKVSTKG